ncbi:hypothetical protein Q1695_009367 [Nippostrongylus brasiliensis]|nr:hypothetical protein Q1695_009367 [Nippostrongylus brasiliensis]
MIGWRRFGLLRQLCPAIAIRSHLLARMQSGRSEANSEDGIWSDDADVTASFTLPPVATLSLKPSVSRSVIQDDDDDNDFCDEQSPPLNCKCAYSNRFFTTRLYCS